MTAEGGGPWLRLGAMVLTPLLSAVCIRDRRGFENLPVTGGVIVAANHICPADGLVLGEALYDTGRLPRLLTKAELFDVPLVGRFMRGTRQIPVHREGGHAADTLRDAVTALAEGACVVVFPEGTNTKDPDHWPMRAHTGVGRLALASQSPVIPVAQWGAHEFFRPDKRPKLSRPLRKPVRLLAGRPVDLSRYYGRPPGPEVFHEITDVVMARVREQLGVLRGETPPARVFDPRAVA